MFNVPIPITIDGQIYFKTKTGSILTIVYALLSIVIIYFSIENFVENRLTIQKRGQKATLSQAFNQTIFDVLIKTNFSKDSDDLNYISCLEVCSTSKISQFFGNINETKDDNALYLCFDEKSFYCLMTDTQLSFENNQSKYKLLLIIYQSFSTQTMKNETVFETFELDQAVKLKFIYSSYTAEIGYFDNEIVSSHGFTRQEIGISNSDTFVFLNTTYSPESSDTINRISFSFYVTSITSLKIIDLLTQVVSYTSIIYFLIRFLSYLVSEYKFYQFAMSCIVKESLKSGLNQICMVDSTFQGLPFIHWLGFPFPKNMVLSAKYSKRLINNQLSLVNVVHKLKSIKENQNLEEQNPTSSLLESFDFLGTSRSLYYKSKPSYSNCYSWVITAMYIVTCIGLFIYLSKDSLFLGQVTTFYSEINNADEISPKLNQTRFDEVNMPIMISFEEIVADSLIFLTYDNGYKLIRSGIRNCSHNDLKQFNFTE